MRDQDAVTHVFASTKLDTFFGLGSRARAGSVCGRWSFSAASATDRLSECLGQGHTWPRIGFFARYAPASGGSHPHGTLPAQAKIDIGAYVAGVNAFISTHHGSRLPLEFHAAALTEPESRGRAPTWSPRVKMMAWDLSKNYSIELLRHDLRLDSAT